MGAMTPEELVAFRAADRAIPHCNECGADTPAAIDTGFCSTECAERFFDNTVIVRMPDGELVAFMKRRSDGKPTNLQQVRGVTS